VCKCCAETTSWSVVRPNRNCTSVWAQQTRRRVNVNSNVRWPVADENVRLPVYNIIECDINALYTVYTYGYVIYNHYIKVGIVFSLTVTRKIEQLQRAALSLSQSPSIIALRFSGLSVFFPPEAVCQPPACENATTTTITIYTRV